MARGEHQTPGRPVCGKGSGLRLDPDAAGQGRRRRLHQFGHVLGPDEGTGPAEELTSEGFTCVGYKTNVLEPDSLEAVHQQVLADLGPCDILLNGAGGNDPRATTDNEYQHEAQEGQKTFFDLDAAGVDFVFKLNFQGTLLPTQTFAKDMVARKSGCILNISSMNAWRVVLHRITGHFGNQGPTSWTRFL